MHVIFMMNMKKQTILVVDDEVIFAQSVKNYILEKSEVYRVITAENGKEALEVLENEHIDLMILDIRMPEMDGIRVLTELHNRNIWLPIIMMTNVLVLTEKEGGTIFGNFGIADYLEKPVNLEKLDKKIEEISNRFKDFKESASGIDIHTILRVIEMEKRTGIMRVNSAQEEGKIFFREGKVVDAEMEGLLPGEALEECLRPGNGLKKVSIEYMDHRRDKKINGSLSGFFLKASLDRDIKIMQEEKARKKNREDDALVEISI